MTFSPRTFALIHISKSRSYSHYAIAIHPIASKQTHGIGNGLVIFCGEDVELGEGEGMDEEEGVGVGAGIGISSADTISTAFYIPPAAIKNSPLGHPRYLCRAQRNRLNSHWLLLTLHFSRLPKLPPPLRF